MKFSGLGRGDSEPNADDIEQEAADELRRAIGGAGQARGNIPSYRAAREMAADAAETGGPYDDSDEYDEYDEYQPARRPSADDERRMATDLAMQQLADRPQGRIRAGATPRQMPSGDAEDMRNRALAAALDRQRGWQQKGAAGDSSPQKPKSLDVHGAQSRVQRVSGANITPSISAKPTLGGYHAPPPEAVPLHQPIAEALAGATTGGPAGGSRSGGGGRPDGAGRRPAPLRAAAIQRRDPRPAAAPTSVTEMDDLEEVIARADEGQALPAVTRWLSEELDSSVALVLVVDGTLDDFIAWPTDSVIAGELMQAVEHPLDRASTITAAMTQGRPLSNRDGVLVMPDGAEAEGCEWVVVPVVIDSEPIGTLFVTRGEGDKYSPAGVKFLMSVAARVAEVLADEPGEEEETVPSREAKRPIAAERSLTAEAKGADVPSGAVKEAQTVEEAQIVEETGEGLVFSNEPAEEGRAEEGRAGVAPSTTADGDQRAVGTIPDATRDWLIALRVVLEGFGSAPSVSMPKYRDIVGGANGLRDQIVELLTLTGPGGPGRGAET